MVTPGGGGGKILGNLILRLKTDGKKLQEGLGKAQKSATGTLGKMQQRWQGFANRIPVVGGALAGLATPAGAATAAIGLATAAIGGMVKKTLDLGRQLGEAREKLNVSAEGIQIWRRAIEETNGDAQAFDSAILRLTRSIGDAENGNAAAQRAFDKLGLSFEDLAKKSPEEALRDVLAAANDTLSPTEKASVLSQTLGRSYANMGGLANLAGDDLDTLLSKVSETAVVMTDEGVDGVDKFDAIWRDTRDTLTRAAVSIGTKVLPKLGELIEGVTGIVTALWPVIDVITTPLQLAFDGLLTVLGVTSSLLRGDFSGAWDHIKGHALNVMEVIATGYNNTIGRIPGVAKIDMEAIRAALETVEEEAVKVKEATAGPTGDGSGGAAGGIRQVTAAASEGYGPLDDYGEKVKVVAEKADDLREAIAEFQRVAKETPKAIDTMIGGGGGMGLNDLIDKLEEVDESIDHSSGLLKRVLADERTAYQEWLQGHRDAWDERRRITEQGTADEIRQLTDAEQVRKDLASLQQRELEGHYRTVLRIDGENNIERLTKYRGVLDAMDEALKENNLEGYNSLKLANAAILAEFEGLALNLEARAHIARKNMEGEGIGGSLGRYLKLLRSPLATRHQSLSDAQFQRSGELADARSAAQLAHFREGGTVETFRSLLNNLPHLDTGGITTRDTFAMLHADEAVVPLGRSGLGLTGDVTLKVDGFTEAVGQANLRIEERGG